MILSWYLIIASIGSDFISKSIFLLEASLFVGFSSILISRNIFLLNKNDYNNILFIFIVSFGMILSRLLYTPWESTFVNICFILKTFSFFFFISFFLTRKGVTLKTLYLISFFSLPHFIAYVLGVGSGINGQFCGLSGDPNYLGPDLLASTSASSWLINCSVIKRKIKLIFIFTLLISIFLIITTVSRTCIMSLFIIIIFYTTINYIFLKKVFAINYILLALAVTITAFYSMDFLLKLDIVNNIIDRFFYAKKGGNLLENERYYVWDLSYRLILDTGLFQGYGVQNFLINEYRFVSHNSWIDIGIKMGSYTFFAHSIAYGLGLILWFYKLITRKLFSDKNNTETFLFIFSFSISFMMFSISVSHMYYYWLILFLVCNKGILPFCCTITKAKPKFFGSSSFRVEFAKNRECGMGRDK